MSTTQNQTLQDKLLEIEKELDAQKEILCRCQKLNSALDKTEPIGLLIGYILVVVCAVIFFNPTIDDFFLSLLFAFYPGGIVWVPLGFFFEHVIKVVLHKIHKIDKKKCDEITTSNNELDNRKKSIQKQIRTEEEEQFYYRIKKYTEELRQRKLGYEEANEIKSQLEVEYSTISSRGFMIYSGKYYDACFNLINVYLESLKNPVEKNKTITSNNKFTATEVTPKTTQQNENPVLVSKPSAENNSTTAQSVPKNAHPVNSNQKPGTTSEIIPLPKPTTDNNTSHTQKPVVPSTNNTGSTTSIVKSPEPTIISGIVEKLKKTQQRIKSVRIPGISSRKSVPTTRRIPGEKKSTSSGNVKTASEPITEKNDKITAASFSGNTDNVTPVRTKPTVIPEEKTLVELFGEQSESEPESQKEPRQSRASVKTDYLKLNEHRHVIGERGEEFVLELEKRKLATSGFKTLSEQVVHVSKRDDSKGYDILSFFEDGKEKYLEVKTTTEDYNAPFYLSESELVAMKKSNNYFIYRVYNFDINTGKGKYFIMDCKRDIDKHYMFQPVSYRVSPKF